MNSSLRSLIVGGWFAAVRLVSHGVGSYVIGSYAAHFSLGAGIVPLSGFYGGVLGAVSVGCLSFLIHMCVHGSVSWSAIALVVPGAVGGLCMATHSRFIKSSFFLMFMALFWVHPVGQQAFLYPLLWLVPLVLVIQGSNAIFARALISTFIVHAVGACLWLYLVPMPAALWHAMMPQVVVERLVNALAMVAVVYGVEKIGVLFRAYSSIRALSRHAS